MIFLECYDEKKILVARVEVLLIRTKIAIFKLYVLLIFYYYEEKKKKFDVSI